MPVLLGVHVTRSYRCKASSFVPIGCRSALEYRAYVIRMSSPAVAVIAALMCSTVRPEGWISIHGAVFLRKRWKTRSAMR